MVTLLSVNFDDGWWRIEDGILENGKWKIEINNLFSTIYFQITIFYLLSSTI